MGSNNGSGLGCLIWVIAVIGNLLLFGGSLFGDLAGNSIAWIFAILAVVIDVVFVSSLISSQSRRKEQQANARESQNRSAASSPVQGASERPVPIEHFANSKLGQLRAKYSIPAIPTIPTTIDPLQKDMEPFQSAEVLQTVKRVVNGRKELIKELDVKKQELDAILSCPACSTDRERMKYLNANEAVLCQKKKEYLALLDLLKSRKVVLLSKENRVFSQLRGLFSDLTNSQKVAGGASIGFRDFLRNNSALPGDLFKTEPAPIELNYGTYRFFLLPDVVLAYNGSGKFITAFEPMAMIITIEEQKKIVDSSNIGERGWTYTDNIIASDSTMLSRGHVRSGWLHEKRSGGPDLRYSFANNPRYDSRTDIYAFTEAGFQIGRYKALYSVSKGSLAEKAKPIIREYCSISHGVNVLPSLLRLLENTAKDNDGARALYSEYMQVCKDMICKEA